MQKNVYDLIPIRNVILEIYDSIRSICEKYGLKYFVAYGTLLGAIRHRGFIPWDDDFDIWMPRPDYMQFMDLAIKELPKGFSWQSVETDDTYHYLFGKVRVDNPNKVSEISAKSKLSLKQGLYVDIFPLDGLPSSGTARFLWCVKRGMYRRGVSRWFLGMPLGRAKNHLLKFSEWCASRKYADCKFVGGISPYSDGKTPQKWCFPREWFSSSEEAAFEDRIVRVPVGTKKILTAIYGDFMQLPPEEARVPSHQMLEL